MFFSAKLFHCFSVTFMMVTLLSLTKEETLFVPSLNRQLEGKLRWSRFLEVTCVLELPSCRFSVGEHYRKSGKRWCSFFCSLRADEPSWPSYFQKPIKINFLKCNSTKLCVSCKAIVILTDVLKDSIRIAHSYFCIFLLNKHEYNILNKIEVLKNMWKGQNTVN